MIEESERRRDGRTTDTRRRIQAVALELFGTKGASNTSLRDIAERLDITKAALYYHYPSKADLIRSLYEPFIEGTDAFLDDAETRQLGPRELFAGYFDWMLPHRATYLTLLRDASVLAFVDLEAASVRWVDRFQHMLVGPGASDEQKVRAIVAIGGLARTLAITGITVERVRSAAIEAALAALGNEAGANDGRRPGHGAPRQSRTG